MLFRSTMGIWPACASRVRPTTTQRAVSRVNIADRGIRWSRREKGFLEVGMLYIIGPLLLREQFSIRHHSLEEVQCNELVPNSTPTCYVDPVDAASRRNSMRYHATQADRDDSATSPCSHFEYNRDNLKHWRTVVPQRPRSCSYLSVTWSSISMQAYADSSGLKTFEASRAM